MMKIVLNKTKHIILLVDTLYLIACKDFKIYLLMSQSFDHRASQNMVGPPYTFEQWKKQNN